jgi:hypothetical protein
MSIDQDTSHYLPGEEHVAHAGGATLPPIADFVEANFIPGGVHPGDASTASEHGPAPYDEEKPQQHRPGRKPWDTANEEALPVNQRASRDWGPGTCYVSTGGVNSGVSIVVGRQKGRSSITIWVPSLMPNGVAPLGVLIAADPSALQTQGVPTDVVVLNVGDSVTIASEGAVWAGVIGANASGACQFIQTTNPLGRGRDLSAS